MNQIRKKAQSEVIHRLMDFAKTLTNRNDYFLERIPKAGTPLQIVSSLNTVIETYDKVDQEKYDRLVFDMSMEGLLD